MATSFSPAFTIVGHALMRTEPSSKATVASDTFFSERVEILGEAKKWLHIRTCVDGYEGWVRKKAIGSDLSNEQELATVKVNRLRAHLYSIQDTEQGPFRVLPFSSRLKVVEEIGGANGRWIKVLLPTGKEAFIQRGDITSDLRPLAKEQLVDFARTFLGIPYSWGGRSSFGYDCSGFIQMLYREMGIALPRDSKDQFACEKLEPVALDRLEIRDLLFWGRSAEKIGHVGMYIGDGTFIHATVKENQPYIHISRLSDSDWNGSGILSFCAARRLRESDKKGP